MSQPDPPSVTFRVRAADRAADIFLIDGQFRLVDRGIGEKSFSVPPGVYKLKQRCGNATGEQLLIVREGMEPPALPRLEFASAIPLAATAETHESHMSAAADASSRIDDARGTGSGVVLVVRDWTSSDAAKQNAENIPDPSRGLKLRDFDGALIADFEAKSRKGPGKEPWATCHLAVAPGLYRLCLERPDGARVEQTIVACPGWDTCVYLLLDRSSKDREPRADLINGAITMLRAGTRFDPGDPAIRAEELARMALADDRKILSEEIRAQIVDPGASPMLALFGSHLLIREARDARRAAEERGQKSEIDNTGPVRTVVANLRKTIGEHPDVEAIAIGAGARNPSYAFRAPPMLRDSWALLLRASVDDPAVIPPGSFNGRISDRLWGDGPWMLWIDPDQPMATGGVSWRTAATEILQNLQETPLAGAAPTPAETTVAPAKPPVPAAPESGSWFSGLVNSLLAFARNALPGKLLSFFRRRSRAPFPSSLEESSRSPRERAPLTADSLRDLLNDRQTRKDLVGRIGIPLGAINEWLETLKR